MITKSTGKVFTSIAAAVRVPKLVKALDLTQSEDLRCRNVVCEKFDEPCLCRISRVLERLESLESLSLAANDLTSLPPAVFALKQLRTLDISKNCLAEVQPDIAALESLQVLRLQGNPQLADLPRAAVQSLGSLHSLHVDPALADSLRAADTLGFFERILTTGSDLVTT